MFETGSSNTSRRAFLCASATTLAAATPACSALSRILPGADGKRPNIVFFLGEGARPDESSLAGNKFLKTPHLDRIGREGVVFNNAFCTNALCLPARATILSGMYSHTTGAVDNQRSKVPPNFAIVSDLIRKQGYDIAFIGKSHVEGALLDRYWDYYFGFRGQADYQHPFIVEGRNGKYNDGTMFDGYVDDLLTERAVAWLEEPHEKPFCLFLWFYAPHAPFVRPLRDVLDFNGVLIPPPASFDEYKNGYAGKPKGVVDALNKVGMQFFGNDDPRSYEELVKDHYAGIESNDEDMGKVFKVLEDKKLMDDTAVMWSSDHGFFLGEHRFYDKRLMYEPSIRVPMMLRYPKRIKAGTVSDKMVINTDIAPTLLDLAGATVPPEFQGKSMMPLAEGRHVPWRKDWLYEYYEYPGYENVPPCRGVRTERYAYIDYFTQNAFELYDLKTDSDELRNVYADPAYADVVVQLRKRLDELRHETKDTYVYTPTQIMPMRVNHPEFPQ